MPNVTAYIRVSDLSKWKALRDKSAAIHEMLNSLPPEAFNISKDGPNQFNRSEFLKLQREERNRTNTVPQRTAPIASNGPDEPELVVTPKNDSVYKHTFTSTEPAPAKLISNLPKEIQGAFVKASSLQAPPLKPNNLTEEQPCCAEPSPCRHWVWDIGSGDGYVNSISGRKKIAE